EFRLTARKPRREVFPNAGQLVLQPPHPLLRGQHGEPSLGQLPRLLLLVLSLLRFERGPGDDDIRDLLPPLIIDILEPPPPVLGLPQLPRPLDLGGQALGLVRRTARRGSRRTRRVGLRRRRVV